MFEQLKIGEPVTRKVRRKVWRLHVKSMHGDADAYTTTKQDYLETPDVDKYEYGTTELSHILYVLKGIFGLSANQQRKHGDVDRLIAEAYEKYPTVERNDDLLCDVLPSDQFSNGSYYARIEELWITYFDENGIEHDVILPDEKKRWRNA